MGKNWKIITAGLDVSFATIFYFSAARLAMTAEWAVSYALAGLLWSVVAIPDIKELALELRKR